LEPYLIQTRTENLLIGRERRGFLCLVLTDCYIFAKKTGPGANAVRPSTHKWVGYLLYGHWTGKVCLEVHTEFYTAMFPDLGHLLLPQLNALLLLVLAKNYVLLSDWQIG